MYRAFLVGISLLSTLLSAAEASPASPYCGYPRLPLRTGLSSDVAWQREAYTHAFQCWEKALGAPVFEWTTNHLDMDVLIAAGPLDPKRPNTMATTHRVSALGRCKSLILVRQPMNRAQAELFGVHELGHALGVDHALPGSGDVMEPVLDYRVADSYAITARDIAMAKANLGLR